jgi:hypothetical protein
VAAVAAAVVGQHPLDDHAAVGEPGLGSSQEPGCSLPPLVEVDLGIGKAGMIIDRGVDEPMADQWIVMAAAPAAGPVGPAVPPSAGPAQEPVAAPGGDVAQLLDIDMNEVAGLVVLVAAHRLAGRPVQMGETADPAADQHGMHGRGGQPDLRGDLGWPSRWAQRRCTILRTTGGGVRRGEEWGRLDRSAIPALLGHGSGWPTAGRSGG